MKAHHKRIRLLRRLALAGCLAGLAVPAGASAMLPKDYSTVSASQEQPYTLPASFHTEVQASAQSSAQKPLLPTRVRTEIARNVQPSPAPTSASMPDPVVVHVQSPAPTSASLPDPVVVHVQSPDHNPIDKAIALRRTFHPNTQPTSRPAPAVIRQIETVTDNSGRTLAIVLASIALAVALSSLGYATVRLAQIQRRSLGSGSH
jgi:hypothetical protein